MWQHFLVQFMDNVCDHIYFISSTFYSDGVTSVHGFCNYHIFFYDFNIFQISNILCCIKQSFNPSCNIFLGGTLRNIPLS